MVAIVKAPEAGTDAQVEAETACPQDGPDIDVAMGILTTTDGTVATVTAVLTSACVATTGVQLVEVPGTMR
jgi:hypothetical protein